MNVNTNLSPQASRMEKAPEPRRFRSPAEVLSILAPDAGRPGPLGHSGLWKMPLEPQGA